MYSKCLFYLSSKTLGLSLYMTNKIIKSQRSWKQQMFVVFIFKEVAGESSVDSLID